VNEAQTRRLTPAHTGIDGSPRSVKRGSVTVAVFTTAPPAPESVQADKGETTGSVPSVCGARWGRLAGSCLSVSWPFAIAQSPRPCHRPYVTQRRRRTKENPPALKVRGVHILMRRLDDLASCLRVQFFPCNLRLRRIAFRLSGAFFSEGFLEMFFGLHFTK